MIKHKLHNLKQYKYESIAFLSGLTVMIIELVGVRFVAPHFGASIYVWTAIIGVVLGSLAVGYWYGGRLADKSASDKGLAMIFIMAAVVWLVSIWLKDDVLGWVSNSPGGLRSQALVASMFLFGPVGVLLGTVSPYLVKLKVDNLKTTGRHVGELYAAGTVGSIAGTFAAGYWLIPEFSSSSTGWAMVFILVVISILANWRVLWVARALILLSATGLYLSVGNDNLASQKVIYEGDGLYSQYRVLEAKLDGKQARILATDKFAYQSGIFIDDKAEPALDYAKRINELFRGFEPQKVLIIGGGTYTLATNLIEQAPETKIDIVEIDPALSKLAQDYFYFQANDNIQIYHEDGRTFLNRIDAEYDMIIVDAFNSLFPPFQLTTYESTEKLKANLSSRGIVAVNIISDLSSNGFINSELLTYRQVFKNAVVHGENTESAKHPGVQNMILVASNDSATIAAVKLKVSTNELEIDQQNSILLTDDYAPVESLTARSLY